MNQFQYCEENQIPLCAVIGESELAKNVVMLRDMAKREQVIKSLLKKVFFKSIVLIMFYKSTCNNTWYFFYIKSVSFLIQTEVNRANLPEEIVKLLELKS